MINVNHFYQNGPNGEHALKPAKLANKIELELAQLRVNALKNLKKLEIATSKNVVSQIKNLITLSDLFGEKLIEPLD